MKALTEEGKRKMVRYEKAENAKQLLIRLLDEAMADNKSIKEIEQLDVIIRKLESWQNKYDK